MFSPVRLSPDQRPRQSPQGNTATHNATVSSPRIVSPADSWREQAEVHRRRRGFAGISPTSDAGQVLLNMGTRSRRRPLPNQPQDHPDFQVVITQQQLEIEAKRQNKLG